MNYKRAIKEFEEELHTQFDEKCKSAELICDQIFQDMANCYDVYIDTSGDSFCVYNGVDVALKDSNPIFICGKLLYNLMCEHFGEIWVGRKYKPISPKNSNLPAVVIVTSQEGDWEGMYIDGEVVFQSHKITRMEFAELTQNNDIMVGDIIEFEVSDMDDIELRENGRFPDKLENFLTDYGSNGIDIDMDETEALEPILCGFDMAWVGNCKKPVVEGETACRDHINIKCGCGKQATRDCEHTIGAFICGRNLCDSCRCNH